MAARRTDSPLWKPPGERPPQESDCRQTRRPRQRTRRGPHKLLDIALGRPVQVTVNPWPEYSELTDAISLLLKMDAEQLESAKKDLEKIYPSAPANQKPEAARHPKQLAPVAVPTGY
jgi:hypothetical protein